MIIIANTPSIAQKFVSNAAIDLTENHIFLRGKV